MSYRIEFKEQAKDDIKHLKKSEPLAYKKLVKLLDELTEHPTTGTGQPEALKYELSGHYSRRITQKHRLVYQIKDTQVLVLVLSAYGHYDDK